MIAWGAPQIIPFVRLSVRPSVNPSARPPIRPSSGGTHFVIVEIVEATNEPILETRQRDKVRKKRILQIASLTSELERCEVWPKKAKF